VVGLTDWNYPTLVDLEEQIDGLGRIDMNVGRAEMEQRLIERREKLKENFLNKLKGIIIEEVEREIGIIRAGNIDRYLDI
jgi:hypothetical protein